MSGSLGSLKRGSFLADPRYQKSGRRLVTVLGVLALSAHLILPLVYTCRSYKKAGVRSCCAAGTGASFAQKGGEAPRANSCPYCTMLSPLKHAGCASPPPVSPRVEVVHPRSVLRLRFISPQKELTANLARAPPSFS
jgi:hypothetical protein